MTEIVHKVIEPSLAFSSDDDLWIEYDNYVYNNTRGFTWIKWQIYKLFGYRHDKIVTDAIFKVRFDTLKNQL